MNRSGPFSTDIFWSETDNVFPSVDHVLERVQFYHKRKYDGDYRYP